MGPSLQCPGGWNDEIVMARERGGVKVNTVSFAMGYNYGVHREYGATWLFMSILGK
jgi:hypothetical protein